MRRGGFGVGYFDGVAAAFGQADAAFNADVLVDDIGHFYFARHRFNRAEARAQRAAYAFFGVDFNRQYALLVFVGRDNLRYADVGATTATGADLGLYFIVTSGALALVVDGVKKAHQFACAACYATILIYYVSHIHLYGIKALGAGLCY